MYVYSVYNFKNQVWDTGSKTLVRAIGAIGAIT